MGAFIAMAACLVALLLVTDAGLASYGPAVWTLLIVLTAITAGTFAALLTGRKKR